MSFLRRQLSLNVLERLKKGDRHVDVVVKCRDVAARLDNKATGWSLGA